MDYAKRAEKGITNSVFPANPTALRAPAIIARLPSLSFLLLVRSGLQENSNGLNLFGGGEK